jgi:hypothetical protein
MRRYKPHRPRNLRPRTPDAMALDKMRQLRDDLSTERPIHFYLYFPSRKDAECAGEELLKQGFSIECERSATGSKWLCLATKKMLPDLVELDLSRTALEQVASKRNGEFDGWESQVIRNVGSVSV